MKPVNLDFINQTASAGKRAGLILLLAGVALSVWMIEMYSQSRSVELKIKAGLERSFGNRNSELKKKNGDIEPEIHSAAKVIDQLSFPWSKLFQLLESSVDEEVALLSIEPDLEHGIVVLGVEAKDWNAMLGYIKRLSAEKSFVDVHLVSHQIQQSDPQKPVRFVLSCSWGKDFRK